MSKLAGEELVSTLEFWRQLPFRFMSCVFKNGLWYAVDKKGGKMEVYEVPWKDKKPHVRIGHGDNEFTLRSRYRKIENGKKPLHYTP